MNSQRVYRARDIHFSTDAEPALVTDIFEYCAAEVPNWNTISISGYHIREAGSTAAQEVAFTIANGIAYVQAAFERGLEVDNFAPRLSFFFNAHNTFWRKWQSFARPAGSGRRQCAIVWSQDPRSMMLRFHAQTAGSTLTAQQPDVNIVRTTIQALAAFWAGRNPPH